MIISRRFSAPQHQQPDDRHIHQRDQNRRAAHVFGALNEVVVFQRNATHKRGQHHQRGQVLTSFFCQYITPMTRQLRLEFPGAIYHVTARGNARAIIFLEDEDRD